MTTAWDVYQTIMHLLLDQTNINNNINNNKNNEYFSYLKSLNKKNFGQSMFMPIDERNCKNSGIPDSLCICNDEYENNLDNELTLKIKNFLLDVINYKYLKNFTHKCEILKYNKIIDSIKYLSKNKYTVIFQTIQDGAVFEGTVVNKSNQFYLIGNITRLTMYGLSSHCVDNYFLKNYCSCFKKMFRHKTVYKYNEINEIQRIHNILLFLFFFIVIVVSFFFICSIYILIIL